MITQEFKDLWIKTLRSGAYKQGHNELGHADIGYCCIGIAGMLAGLEKPNNKLGCIDVKWMTYYVAVTELSLLPDQVDKLTSLNDCHKRDFNYIANWIEENVQASQNTLE